MTTEQETRDQQAVDQIRKALADGFAYVRGAEIRDGLATLTFDEMLARAINEIDTDQSDIRPSKLTSVRNVRQAVSDAMEQVRRLPPEMFALTNESETMGTNVDGSGPTVEDAEGTVEEA